MNVRHSEAGDEGNMKTRSLGVWEFLKMGCFPAQLAVGCGKVTCLWLMLNGWISDAGTLKWGLFPWADFQKYGPVPGWVAVTTGLCVCEQSRALYMLSLIHQIHFTRWLMVTVVTEKRAFFLFLQIKKKSPSPKFCKWEKPVLVVTELIFERQTGAKLLLIQLERSAPSHGFRAEKWRPPLEEKYYLWCSSIDK